MKYENVLGRDEKGFLWLKSRGLRSRPVCTVLEACRLLKRTRRQVYRQIAAGHLESAGRWLGQRLLDRASVERLKRSPLARQPIPARLQGLFPEYRVRRMNAGRDGVLVMARILENGGLKDLRWLIKRYSRRALEDFIRKDGTRMLSPRALRLWSLVLSVAPEPLRPLRLADPWRKVAS